MNDLFTFLNKAYEGDYVYVDQLDDEDLKKISAFLLLGWAQGALSNTNIHVPMTNEYFNRYVFSLSKHPRLLLKLFISANSGMGNTRYKYKKSPNSEKSSIIKSIARYYEIGYNEAKDCIRVLSDDDIKRIVDFQKT